MLGHCAESLRMNRRRFHRSERHFGSIFCCFLYRRERGGFLVVRSFRQSECSHHAVERSRCPHRPRKVARPFNCCPLHRPVENSSHRRPNRFMRRQISYHPGECGSECAHICRYRTTARSSADSDAVSSANRACHVDQAVRFLSSCSTYSMIPSPADPRLQISRPIDLMLSSRSRSHIRAIAAVCKVNLACIDDSPFLGPGRRSRAVTRIPLAAPFRLPRQRRHEAAFR